MVLAHNADREALLPSRRMANYMRRNYASWHTFATETLDVDITKEEIIFVRGHVKTKEWAVAAFVHEGRSAQLTVNADAGSVASAAFSFSHSTDVTVPPERNQGPKNKKHGHRRSHGGARRSATQHDEDKADQCIFLHYYKLKVRLGFWTTVMKAAAGPHELSPGPDDDDPGALWAGADVNDTMDDVVIEQVPVPQKVTHHLS